MGLSVIFTIGIAAAAFVGINIGGSSTGVAFGPATGSDLLSMRQAAALMTVFFLLGGATLGRNVVDRLGTEFVGCPAFRTDDRGSSSPIAAGPASSESAVQSVTSAYRSTNVLCRHPTKGHEMKRTKLIAIVAIVAILAIALKKRRSGSSESVEIETEPA